jgi:hypothetical protein
VKTTIVVLLVVLAIALPAAASDKPIRFSLSLAIVGLGIADAALTIYGTTHGLVETNRLWRGIVERRDWLALWTVEALGTGILVLAFNILVHNKPTRIVGYALAVTVVLARSYIVWHNAKLNGRLR